MADINPEKKSGQQAVLQTRQEHYDGIAAEHQNPQDGVTLTPLPELIKANDTVLIGGNRVVVKDEDVTATDIRVICLGNGKCTGWAKAKDTDATIAGWNTANPVS